jgi:hypothetical protein
LAKGRVTEEIEEWVLWKLPFARALAYQHCCLRSNGQWTVPLGRPLEDRFKDLTLIAQRFSDEDEED